MLERQRQIVHITPFVEHSLDEAQSVVTRQSDNEFKFANFIFYDPVFPYKESFSSERARVRVHVPMEHFNGAMLVNGKHKYEGNDDAGINL